MRIAILDTSNCQEGVTVEIEKDTDIAVSDFDASVLSPTDVSSGFSFIARPFLLEAQGCA
jgi:hypothetical protein